MPHKFEKYGRHKVLEPKPLMLRFWISWVPRMKCMKAAGQSRTSAGPRSEPVGRSGQNSSNRQSIQQTPKFKHFFSGSWRSWGLQFLLVQDRKVLFFHQNMPEHQENHCVLNKSKVQFSTFPTGFPFNLGNKIVFWFLFLLYTLPVGRILAWSPDWFRLRAHRFRLFSWI